MPHKLNATIDRFNQSCAFFRKALAAHAHRDFNGQENALRKSATECVGALEWAMKHYLRNVAVARLSPADWATLKQPNFETLTEMMIKYARPNLPDDLVAEIRFSREDLRNPAEHSAAVPSVEGLCNSLKLVRNLMVQYIRAGTGRLAPVPDVPAPLAQPSTRMQVNGYFARTPLEFRPSIGGHQHAVVPLVEFPAQAEPVVRKVLASIFDQGLDLLSADDPPDLIHGFLDELEQPLSSLHAMGLTIFVVDTLGAGIKLDSGTKWEPQRRIVYYLIVPDRAYFCIRERRSPSVVHRFSGVCSEGLQGLAEVLRRHSGVRVWECIQAVESLYPSGVPWCLACDRG